MKLNDVKNIVDYYFKNVPASEVFNILEAQGFEFESVKNQNNKIMDVIEFIESKINALKRRHFNSSIESEKKMLLAQINILEELSREIIELE